VHPPGFSPTSGLVRLDRLGRFFQGFKTTQTQTLTSLLILNAPLVRASSRVPTPLWGFMGLDQWVVINDPNLFVATLKFYFCRYETLIPYTTSLMSYGQFQWIVQVWVVFSRVYNDPNPNPDARAGSKCSIGYGIFQGSNPTKRFNGVA